jgi:two-component system KDP operon response regulator KdpE
MSAAPIKVLVIDDEPPIRKLLRMGLSTQGYEILEASNGKIALEKLTEEPALIILDLGLPDIQGHELLRTIRARNEAVPIVVLSSRGDEAGKVQALDLGADDYLTKPFGMDELLARLRAALRHQLQVQGERPVFRSGDLSVDLVRRIVKVGERDVKLSPKEYDLLRVLVQHAGKVLTHRFLLKELWDELTDAQYLRVYVRQLRQKIEADPERPQYVLTETGIGYRLKAGDLASVIPGRASARARNQFLHTSRSGRWIPGSMLRVPPEGRGPLPCLAMPRRRTVRLPRAACATSPPS